MNHRSSVAVATIASLAGCTESFDGEESGPLDLTIQNERADPVTVEVEVVDEEGTRIEDTADRIDSDVARALGVVVGTTGCHEVIVTGGDWRGQLAWDAGTCARFDGTVRVTDDSVEVADECADLR